MKRVIAIVAIVLSVGVVVGAFIIGGGDGSTEAKGSTVTTVKSNDVKSGAEAIANAGAKVASEAPAPAPSKSEGKDKDSKSCGAEVKDDGKYEAKKAFVGVSPAAARTGREVELKLRNFAPCSTVTVTVSNGTTSVAIPQLTTDKKGRAEYEFKAPAASVTAYVVTAVGTDGKSATTSLKVISKKS